MDHISFNGISANEVSSVVLVASGPMPMFDIKLFSGWIPSPLRNQQANTHW
jgi:hypothetical protein